MIKQTYQSILFYFKNFQLDILYIAWKYSQVSFISSRASRVFQVSRSAPRPTILLTREL